MSEYTEDPGYEQRVRRETTRQFLQRIGILVLLVVTIATLVRTNQVVNEIRATQKTNSPVVLALGETLDRVKDISAQIKSCVDPNGPCYQDGAKRTGAAIQAINDQAMASALCAQRADVTTLDEMRACVTVLTVRPPRRGDR